MATMKAIKKRITSVNSTKKIMKAMNLVATSNLQKAKNRLEYIRPLSDDLQKVMDGVKASMDSSDDIPLCKVREVKNVAYIVLTGDRGLCGSFNANVSKEAYAFIESKSGKQEKIFAVGRKGMDFLRRRGKNIEQRYPAASMATDFADAELLGSHVISLFLSGEVDEVHVVYTRFINTLTHTPKVVTLLPFNADSGGEAEGSPAVMTFDPDPATFVEHAIPMYVNLTIYGAMLESAVCEYASRMTSMDSATRNATEIIEKLTLDYNRERQSKITQELIEIVTGANAVNN